VTVTFRRRIPLLAAVCALTVGATPHRALADGDPASDYLITQTAFLPVNSHISTAQAGALIRLLSQEQRAGFTIRVAVIARKVDLGADAVLYDRPQYYARFLGEELTYLYKRELLVVMPDGYGVYDNGRVPPADLTTLSKLAKPNSTGGSALLAATERAVRALAKTRGIAHGPTKAAEPAPLAGSEGNAAWIIAILALVVTVTPFVAFFGVRRQWQSEAEEQQTESNIADAD
jgi:hypothetical protein